MPFRSHSAVEITNLIYNGPPRCKLGGFLLRFDAGLFGGYDENEEYDEGDNQ